MDPQHKAIIKAAKTGDESALIALLSLDSTLIHALDKDGSTPLHCASWKGSFAIAKRLLEAGADPNSHNQNEHWGTTPLHAAAHANNANIVTLLLSNGADPNAQDMHGKPPLHHTTFHKATAAAKVLNAALDK